MTGYYTPNAIIEFVAQARIEAAPVRRDFTLHDIGAGGTSHDRPAPAERADAGKPSRRNPTE